METHQIFALNEGEFEKHTDAFNTWRSCVEAEIMYTKIIEEKTQVKQFKKKFCEAVPLSLAPCG